MQREEDGEKQCAKCKVYAGCKVDDTIQSIWIGCDGVEDKCPCTYWAHICCIGFSNARPSDFESLNRFCDKHNEHRIEIENLKGKERLSRSSRR